MQYVLSDKLGFRRDHIITLDNLGQLENGFANGKIFDTRQSFVDEVSKLPGVESVTKCDFLPGKDETGGGATWIALENNNSRTQKTIQADENYLKLLNLQLKEGRFFSKDFATDSLGIVLNEKAVEDFGLKNPIGARIISKEQGFSQAVNNHQNIFTVIGIVRDFHFQSMHKAIAPLMFVNSNKFNWITVGISIQGDHFKTVLADMKKIWSNSDPKHDFQFSFLDQNLAAQYKFEQTEQKIFTIFSLLAIIIACIGLFGLAAFSTIQRTREISIRKVLGALPQNIIMILSKDFLRLVTIACLVAFPVAWWAMNKWLQDFNYRIDISWWIFLLAAAIVITIAMFTIAYQAIKAAIANPVNGLKAE